MRSKFITYLAFLLVIHRASAQVVRNAYEYHVGTWNMQGSRSAITESSKWRSLENYLTDNVQENGEPITVFAVQECGATPENAFHIHPYPPVTNLHDGIRIGDWVDERTWQARNSGVTTNSRDLYIYHCVHTFGLESQRTNLAIVSSSRADEVYVYRTIGEVRPAVCIRIGRRFYCSVHANARTNNQSPRTVEGIENAIQTLSVQDGETYSWMIMGDFNREPDEMRTSLNPVQHNVHREIFHTNIETQNGGKILDYVIAGSSNDPIPQMTAARVEDLHSDHWGVRFYPTNV